MYPECPPNFKMWESGKWGSVSFPLHIHISSLHSPACLVWSTSGIVWSSDSSDASQFSNFLRLSSGFRLTSLLPGTLAYVGLPGHLPAIPPTSSASHPVLASCGPEDGLWSHSVCLHLGCFVHIPFSLPVCQFLPSWGVDEATAFLHGGWVLTWVVHVENLD